MSQDEVNTPPGEGGTPANGEGGTPGVSEVLKEFRAIRDHVDARMSDMGKQMAALKQGRQFTPEPPKKDGDKAPAGLTADDLNAAIKLGEVRSKLSDDARKQVDELLDAGRSHRDALTMAEMAVSMAGAKAPEGGTPVTPGTPRGAAPTNSGGYPTTWRALAELKKENPARFKEIMDPAHPFDPMTIRR